MVLVSKLRSSSQQPATSSSFLTKLRSTFARNVSTTSLQAFTPPDSPSASHAGQCQVSATGTESSLKECDERTLRSTGSCAENFDESTCDTSSGKRTSPVSDCPDLCSWPVEAKEAVSDLQVAASMPRDRGAKRQFALQDSICGNHCSQVVQEASFEWHEEAVAEVESNVEVETETFCDNLVTRFETQPVVGSSSVATLPDETFETIRSFSKQSGELSRRLWDPSEPPAQAHPAWQLKRDKEVPGPVGQKTRFPAKLPPLSKSASLSGLSSKSLRLFSRSTVGSTAVTEVSNLHEWASSPISKVPESPERALA